MTQTTQQDLKVPLEVSIVVTQKNGQPHIELRRGTSETELIKGIISAAFHDTPIIVQPKFTDRLRAINSLLEKGIIYLDTETQQYLYNF